MNEWYYGSSDDDEGQPDLVVEVSTVSQSDDGVDQKVFVCTFVW